MKTINEVIESAAVKSKIHAQVASAAGSILKRVTARFLGPTWTLKGYYKPDAVRSDYRLVRSDWEITVEGCGMPLVAGQCGPTTTGTFRVEAAAPVDDATLFTWTQLDKAEKENIRDAHAVLFDFSEDYEDRRESANESEARISGRGRPAKDGKSASAHIHLRATPERKAAYVKRAQAVGRSLSDWITETCDREAGYHP